MNLQTFFQDNPICAVAFSGGVDSACLLHAAVTYGQRTAAYFVKTPFQPDFEMEDAVQTAARLGAELKIIEFDVLAVPEAAANPANRCYYCKRALFTLLIRAAGGDGFPTVLDGCNASDDAGDRPGMRALGELGVRSPLRECGLSKSDVRAMAREAGLPVWNKPSYACLATRVPTGTPITAEDLRRVERGEGLLAELGLSDFRLRLRGVDALLQVRREQMTLAKTLLPRAKEQLADDFHEITLDNTPRPARET